MALQTTGIALPKNVAKAITTKMKDTSTIAALSPQLPQLFVDSEALVFDGAAEAEIVGENTKKTNYEQSITTVKAQRVKIQTTTRVTSELRWADEDNQLDIIALIQEDQAKALGRALDYIVYHAINPKTGAPASGFTALATSGVQVEAGTDAAANLDLMVEAINEKYELNGFALSKKYANALRKIRVAATGARLFPDIPINLAVGSLEGVAAATSNTVNAPNATTATNVLAVAGDFSLIRWGMVRDITAEVIEYGDPDGTGVDLKQYNQVAYRTEAVLAYSVIDPHAFAVLKAKAV